MQSILAAKIFGDKEDPRVRLQALFGGNVPPSGQPPEPALTWAQEILGAADDRSPSDLMTTIRRLREADSRLTLKAATFLAEHVTGTG